MYNPQYESTHGHFNNIFFYKKSSFKDSATSLCVVLLTNNDQNQFTLHQKLKLSAKLNKIRTDQDLIVKMNQKSPNATYIIGNYFTPNVRFHEPIRDVGFRRWLRKHNINVFLIDEFQTSKTCPQRNNRTLETFKTVQNPRPHRRHT